VELIGLYLVACLLLAAAGVAKAIRPTDTARALTTVVAMPLARMRLVVRSGAVAEAALGVVALLLPRTVTAALVGVSYLAFAAFVAYARSTGGAMASCGCFGKPDTPPTVVHLVVDLGLAAAAFAIAAAAPGGSLASMLTSQPDNGIPLIMASGLCAWLVYLSISVLAEVQGARRLTAVSFRGKG
jgi:Methylamine utilisation protein MauE